MTDRPTDNQEHRDPADRTDGAQAERSRELLADAIERSESGPGRLIDDAAMPIVYYNVDAHVLLMNRQAARHHGGAADDFIGRHVTELLPTIGPREQERICETFRTGRGRDCEDPSGDRWILSSYEPVTDESGAVLAVQVLRRDVTERRRAQQRLEAELELKDSLLRAIPSPVYYRNADGVYTGCNEAFCEFFGKDRHEIIGRNVGDVWPDDLAHQCLERDEELMAGGDTQQLYDSIVVDGQGRHRDVIFHRATYRDEAGQVAGIVGCIVDITERRQAEKLRDAMAAIVAHTEDLAYIKDLDRRIVAANQAFLQASGKDTPEDVIGQTVEEVFGLSPDDPHAQNWREQDSVALDMPRGESLESEEEFAFADGSEHVMLSRIFPVFDSSGNRTGMAAICSDITERKQTEQRRLRLEAQIQQAQKLESLGVLAGGVAHDFNNLLMVILGNTDLAESELPEEHPAREMVENVRKAALRASDLTHQMLAYSGKGRFIIRDLALNELLHEMNHMIHVALPGTTVIEYELAGDLPMIEADVAQMRQVIMNLTKNAAESLLGRPGRIKVRTGVERIETAAQPDLVAGEEIDPGLFVFLEVADDGCGMDEATKHKLFEPFFSTKFTGRGLGLAAVLGVVRGHRGAIRVRTAPGAGTSIRVLLPAPEVPIKRPDTQAKPQDQWQGEGMVLVVDDEDLVRNIACKMLQRLGYTPLSADGGMQALELTREHNGQIKAVLLDMAMPEMDGDEAFDRLREVQPDMPIVLCSGYAEDDARGQFGRSGLAGFLQKPFRLDDLSDLLRRVTSE